MIFECPKCHGLNPIAGGKCCPTCGYKNIKVDWINYKKQPIVVQAYLWSGVEDEMVSKYSLPRFSTGYEECSVCNKKASEHGLIDTLEDVHIVCPGDWIIKGINKKVYPCKPDIFEKTYILGDD